ncbi:hypothetical protein CAter282_3100 [Collimonas arenae]|uniref:Uncharacterized protein n=1 Tax=Collimonas arenae TaxID=279058 RepID=A0A127QL82_9BURK|nr:hypothetical protein CAter282_3100 [Collimonas arenae]
MGALALQCVKNFLDAVGHGASRIVSSASAIRLDIGLDTVNTRSFSSFSLSKTTFFAGVGDRSSSRKAAFLPKILGNFRPNPQF